MRNYQLNVLIGWAFILAGINIEASTKGIILTLIGLIILFIGMSKWEEDK